MIVNGFVLLPVPKGVVTTIVPVPALNSAGIVAVIEVSLFNVNATGVPPTVTLVVPLKA